MKRLSGWVVSSQQRATQSAQEEASVHSALSARACGWRGALLQVWLVHMSPRGDDTLNPRPGWSVLCDVRVCMRLCGAASDEQGLAREAMQGAFERDVTGA